MYFKFWIFFLLLLLSGCNAFIHAQRISREDYIQRYLDWAVEEMLRSGIPASITLAQGMLESDNGNSTLAVKANNHFGIKCHGWKGKKIYHDDDKKRECFRKYKSARESYTDHTDFIMNSPRYSFLFELDPTDYKGWAKGLKKAGYATARGYDDLLVRIIEDNGLGHLDESGTIKSGRVRPDAVSERDEFEISLDQRKILVRNRINYIIVKEGDTYQSLTRELDLMPFELARYNEIERGAELTHGQELYLQPKRNRASVEFKYHTVKEGETMYRISQMYGIKLKKLYQKNLLEMGEEPEPGTVLYLRKKRKPEN